MQILSAKNFIIVCLVGLLASPGYAVSRIGQKVDDFQLQSHLGRDWSLSDFDDKKVIVLAFLGTECPLVKSYSPKLSKMRDEFADRGVEFLGINSNTQDTLTEIRAFANRHEISFPMLKDLGNVVADAVRAERTPEIFVLDSDRMVRYHGRIDDQYSVGYQNGRPQRNELRDAIVALLEGKPVTTPETKPVGCHIGRVSQVEPTGDITFSKHISRIFNKRCVECHREDQLAPFKLDNYDDVVGWEDTILEVIADNRMPPWYANPDHGVFSNDARLTEEEKELIRTWVSNGMPEGDPADLSKPIPFADGWRIPKPDQVVYMSEKPFQVKAEGVVNYQHFTVDPGWDEDKYIYAAEARPDNKSVVHHILVLVVPPESNRPDLRNMLSGYAPGSTPVLLEEGTAIRVPKGHKLVFQLHYTPNGYDTEDRSYVGFCFADKDEVTQLLSGRMAINSRFQIPPKADAYQVTAEYYASTDEKLVSMTPHMHLRGDKFRYEAIYPNGDTEILLDVPDYDFNWQQKYVLAEPKLLPRGTRIVCTAVFDNSENNPVNPDYEKTVGWGNQSFEEMMIGFFDTLPVSETIKSENVTIDPSGRWSWGKVGRLPGGSVTLDLKQDRLSGIAAIRGGERPIENAVITGDQLNFTVSIPQWGISLDFQGKVSQDNVVGTISAQGGPFGPIPWKAVRSE